MPTIREFALNASTLATRVYKRERHGTTSVGVAIEKEVQDELRSFLASYLAFIGAKDDQCLRIDAFPKGDYLDIIEVNVEVREGWGISLNLARAAGHAVAVPEGARLPSAFVLYKDDYLPEYELALGEFERLGHRARILPWQQGGDTRRIELELDDKLHLARFARVWRGNRVRIPSMYAAPDIAYDELPEHVVFKFRQKLSRLADTAGYSVITRADPRFGKAVRRWYDSSEMIAQHRIGRALLADESVAQCILMCAGSEPVTGYLQVAPPETFVINDKSAAKGPLVFA